MGMEDGAGLLRQLMDRRMDAIAGALDLAFAGEPRAIVSDFHEAARRHLGPVEPERNLVVAIVGAGDPECQMVEDALMKVVHHAEPMRGGEIDARLPARGFEVYALLDGFLQHASPPWDIGTTLSRSPDEAKRNPGSARALTEVLGCKAFGTFITPSRNRSTFGRNIHETKILAIQVSI